MFKARYYLSIWMLLLSPIALAQPVDHSPWNQLLASHVESIDNGKSTAVDYQGMMNERPKLQRYLKDLSSVTTQQFDASSKQEQLAFLINAYNARTVELILSAWPDIKSIKELGSIFSSPWSKDIVDLLGEKRSLDDIEHKLIRGSGRYNDPRIHFAVNCASIGCPALRAEAYEGRHLERQIDEQTRLFLSNRNQNRIDKNVLEISSIFKWYREDFEKGWLGYRHLEDFLAAYAKPLGLSPQQLKQFKTRSIELELRDYDWRLNKKR